jgi:hypothetical protein
MASYTIGLWIVKMMKARINLGTVYCN